MREGSASATPRTDTRARQELDRPDKARPARQVPNIRKRRPASPVSDSGSPRTTASGWFDGQPIRHEHAHVGRCGKPAAVDNAPCVTVSAISHGSPFGSGCQVTTAADRYPNAPTRCARRISPWVALVAGWIPPSSCRCAAFVYQLPRGLSLGRRSGATRSDWALRLICRVEPG